MTIEYCQKITLINKKNKMPIKKININQAYIYNIGHHTCEESEHTQLYCLKKFNKKEFHGIVAKASANVINKHEIKNCSKLSFQDIHSEVIEDSVKTFGFKEVEFTSEFSVFGRASILDENELAHDRSEQLNALTNAVKEMFKK